MTFEESIKKAARAAELATKRAMKKYSRGEVTDEDDITGVLAGHLDAQFSELIGDLEWSCSIARHRKGSAAEEKRTGADLLIHVRIRTREKHYSKGVLIQAKRVEPGATLTTAGQRELHNQCGSMLSISPSSFVFDYAKKELRVASATKIHGIGVPIALFAECDWTAYRFFLELFRCPIGDPKIKSASFPDLVPYVVSLKGVATEIIKSRQ